MIFTYIATVATIAIFQARGDTYTVNAGDTQTLDSVTNTTRFTKSGAGTLVVTGTNSLTSLTSSGGTLNFHGGETTISGAGSSGAYGDAAFVNNGQELIVDGGATVKITGGAYAHSNNGILLVTNGIAAVFDGEYGTLTFGNTCSLAGDYTIVGDTNGCGCVKFNQRQDISNLSLSIANVEKLDEHARSDHYKIVNAPNGITGAFSLAADWPRGWAVKYAADGTSVYVYYQNGTRFIVR